MMPDVLVPDAALARKLADNDRRSSLPRHRESPDAARCWIEDGQRCRRASTFGASDVVIDYGAVIPTAPDEWLEATLEESQGFLYATIYRMPQDVPVLATFVQTTVVDLAS